MGSQFFGVRPAFFDRSSCSSQPLDLTMSAMREMLVGERFMSISFRERRLCASRDKNRHKSSMIYAGLFTVTMRSSCRF